MKILCFLKILLIWESKRDNTQVGGGAEGKGPADSGLSTEPNAGRDPTTLRSRPDLKLRLEWVTNGATQAPLRFLKYILNLFPLFWEGIFLLNLLKNNSVLLSFCDKVFCKVYIFKEN